LIYRNSFAAELFQKGNTGGVIAMGLCANARLEATQMERLISGLSNTELLGEIVNALRTSSSSEKLEDRIPTAGIALFTNDPTLTILAPRQNP
ncbi:MAG: hypothetical protein ACRD8U_10090, partial [Pyrinomonadaceae bacterium]